MTVLSSAMRMLCDDKLLNKPQACFQIHCRKKKKKVEFAEFPVKNCNTHNLDEKSTKSLSHKLP